jgi:hypothetical protein
MLTSCKYHAVGVRRTGLSQGHLSHIERGETEMEGDSAEKQSRIREIDRVAADRGRTAVNPQGEMKRIIQRAGFVLFVPTCD